MLDIRRIYDESKAYKQIQQNSTDYPQDFSICTAKKTRPPLHLSREIILLSALRFQTHFQLSSNCQEYMLTTLV